MTIGSTENVFNGDESVEMYEDHMIIPPPVRRHVKGAKTCDRDIQAGTTNAINCSDSVAMDEESMRMPPPARRFLPGTKEFRESIKTGSIKCSLEYIQMNRVKERSHPSRGKGECVVVSPESEAIPCPLLRETNAEDGNALGDPVCSRSISDADMKNLNSTEIPSFPVLGDNDFSGRTNLESCYTDNNGTHTLSSTRSEENTSNIPAESGSASAMECSDDEQCSSSFAVSQGSSSKIESGNCEGPTESSMEKTKSAPAAGNGRFSVEPTHETTRFSDVVGHGNVKLRIDEVSDNKRLVFGTVLDLNLTVKSQILLPLGLPRDVADSVLCGIRSQPTSVLLYGPPGCGKVSRSGHLSRLFPESSVSRLFILFPIFLQTRLARAIAGEGRAAFISIAPSDVLSKFVGESEAAVRSIFQMATTSASKLESKCSVIFFDEIDALGHTRENGGSGEGEGCSRRVLAELLLQLNVALTKRPSPGRKDIKDQDGRESFDDTRILVVAATNRPEVRIDTV